MELDEFKDSIKESAAILRAIQTVIPKRVDTALLDYLDRLQSDPCGLELLRNVLSKQAGQRS